jgi:hypothetical protein
MIFVASYRNPKELSMDVVPIHLISPSFPVHTLHDSFSPFPSTTTISASSKFDVL